MTYILLFIALLAIELIYFRLASHFNIMESLLITSQMCLLKGEDIKLISIFVLLIFSFFFLYQSIVSYPDLFDPYKGVFLNSDFQRSMF